MFDKNSFVVRALASIARQLTGNQKRTAVFLFFLSLVSSLLDIFGLASLVPMLLIIAEPGGILKNTWTSRLYFLLNFQSERSFLLFLIAGMILFFLLKTYFVTWVNLKQAKFTGNIGYNLVIKQVNKYSGLSYLEYSNIGSSKLVTNSLDVPFLFTQNIVRPAIVLLSELLIATIILLGIVVYKPIIFIILFVILGPICGLTYRFIRNRAQHLSERLNNLRTRSLGIVNDLFVGFVELRLAGKQGNLTKKLFATQAEFQDIDNNVYLYNQIPARIIELAAIVGVLIIFIYTIFAGDANINLIALIGLFAAAAYRLMPSLNRILTVLLQFKNYQFVLDEIDAYGTSEKGNTDVVTGKNISFNHTIVLKNLVFTFPGAEKPALDTLNLKIKKGEKIGFIGASGSGKTTLMNILLRFYTEQQGVILVDDQPLGDVGTAAWHRLIGYVKQDTFLMHASIQDNITLGEEKPDSIRLALAIEQASLNDFVNSLPMGLDTLIGERGSRLSGGQRQRIGIARALYKQAEVLIMDEATSALDNETEREVNEAINRLSQTDMTILIVAHRLTTLRECNRVYELFNGSLLGEHQYEELIHRVR